MMSMAEVLVKAMGRKDGVYWVIAPTFRVVDRAWSLFGEVAGTVPYTTVKSKNMRVIEPTGSRIYWLSAEDPDALVGEGLDGVVIDEAARCGELTWQQSVRPALADKLGWAILISTPKGRGWFYREWMKGRPGMAGYESGPVYQGREEIYEREYSGIIAPSHENPVLARSELEQMKVDLSEDRYRQEVLAEFLDDAGQVFKGVEKIVDGERLGGRGGRKVGWDPGARYKIGVDLAKVTDWTVCCVLDVRSGDVVEIDRFNRIDWPRQVKRIKDLAEKWQGELIVDSTGVGEPIYDALRKDSRMPVRGVKLSGPKKEALIQDLMVVIEKEQIALPDDPDLVGELLSYSYQQLPSGNVRYEAPSGMHDDCVISLALAVNGMRISSDFIRVV